MIFRGKARVLSIPYRHQEGVMDIAVAVRPDVQDPARRGELLSYSYELRQVSVSIKLSIDLAAASKGRLGSVARASKAANSSASSARLSFTAALTNSDTDCSVSAALSRKARCRSGSKYEVALVREDFIEGL